MKQILGSPKIGEMEKKHAYMHFSHLAKFISMQQLRLDCCHWLDSSSYVCCFDAKMFSLEISASDLYVVRKMQRIIIIYDDSLKIPCSMSSLLN